MKALANTFHKAIQRRQKLSSVTNAMRLVNGAGDGLDGLLIDRYNKHLHVQVLKDHWHNQIDAIFASLITTIPAEYLIVKSRHGLEIKEEVLIGKVPQTIIEEHGIKFEVNLNDGLNCGLFLDMRQNRWMVGQACKGKKVLNCFSYTCSFGVHARVAGAREVINTDISRKILEHGKRNYQLNALSAAPGEFIKADSVSFLQRALKKGNMFDVIILDPPSFARHEGKVFQVKRDLPKLIALAVAVLNPGGALLITTNYSEISHTDLERILHSIVIPAKAGPHTGHSQELGIQDRRVIHIQRIGQDIDFPGTNSFKESFLAGLWVKFL